ncbi:MAG: ABC transporter ATP-binding protein [Bacilli bacterium]
MKELIRFENVFKVYHNFSTDENVLAGINFSVIRGSIVVILGPSGSGKSTLLNCASGLLDIDFGKIFFDGIDISKFSERRKARFRKQNVGFIFQNYSLLKYLNVYENVLLGARLGKNRVNVHEVLKLVSLAKFSKSNIDLLSGGELQRVAIARAFAKNPRVIFCDEPTGALDYNMTRLVLQALVAINQRYNTTLIIVTHNPNIALIGDRIIKMNSGQIISDVKNLSRIDPSKIPWG